MERNEAAFNRSTVIVRAEKRQDELSAHMSIGFCLQPFQTSVDVKARVTNRSSAAA